MLFAAMWMYQESIIFSEISQREKKFRMISLLCAIPLWTIKCSLAVETRAGELISIRSLHLGGGGQGLIKDGSTRAMGKGSTDCYRGSLGVWETGDNSGGY